MPLKVCASAWDILFLFAADGVSQVDPDFSACPDSKAKNRSGFSRSLFPPTTLKRALEKLGFVQADPIRAPARAQDLTLRHRVKGYRAGDLERRYATLGVEEDVFINYGFVTRPCTR